MNKQVELIKAEIERLMAQEMAMFKEQCQSEEEPNSTSPVVYTTLQMLLHFINSLPEEPSSHEYKLSQMAIEAIDRKRVCPTLKGNALHKFKNEWNTIKQILHWWETGNLILNYRLALHWAAWGAHSLKDLGTMSEEERLKLDIQEEPVSEDLEEAAEEYGRKEYGRKNPIALSDRCRGCYAPIVHAFKAGAQWKEQKMMENAVDGVFIMRNRYTRKNVLHGLDVTCDAIQGFKDKDKLKVIIIKDE